MQSAFKAGANNILVPRAGSFAKNQGRYRYLLLRELGADPVRRV